MASELEDWCPCDSACSVVSECAPTSSHDSQCSQHACYPSSIMSKIEWAASMAGSVKAHHKHIVIAEGSDAARWPEEVTARRDGYAAALDAALKAAKAGLPVRVRSSLSDAITLAEDGQPAGDLSAIEGDAPDAACDLLLFPDAIRITRVRKDQLAEFVAALADYSTKQIAAARARSSAAGASAAAAASASESASSGSDGSSSAADGGVVFPMAHTALEGTWYLICAHKLRDKRCGVSGPILAAEIDRAVSVSYPSSPPPAPVHTVKISHIGGHKFAGNVIVYPGGVWYGRVLPCHVPHLILAHCPEFEYADTSSGERVLVKADSSLMAAQQAKLRPLVRGFVDPIDASAAEPISLGAKAQ